MDGVLTSRIYLRSSYHTDALLTTSSLPCAYLREVPTPHPEPRARRCDPRHHIRGQPQDLFDTKGGRLVACPLLLTNHARPPASATPPHTPADLPPPGNPGTTPSAMQPPATERSPAHYVVRLSGALAVLLSRAGGAELPEDEFVDGLNAAGLVTAAHAATSTPQSVTAASATASSTDRRVLHLWGALAALLGHAAGTELSEAEILDGLREAGLLTYPSPLLGRLLQKVPEVLVTEVLARLDPTDLTLLALVGPQLMSVVVASGLPRAGVPGGVPLKVDDFVGCIELLAWAKWNGCPWDERTCARVAEGGHLDVLKWARERNCPWDDLTCLYAAQGGHLEVLQWARQHGCEWDEWTCTHAAAQGHLEVLRWAREHGCEWDKECVRNCAAGYTEVLKWLDEQSE